jgi:hypothetical protein
MWSSITTPHGVYADPAVGDLRVGPVGEPVQRASRNSANARVLLLLIEGRRDGQDNRDRTSGPMPAAMGRGRTATFRAASAGLDGNQASPLMLFQQSAELSVLRPQGSLCIAHTVMIADRHDARHASGVSGLSKVSTSWLLPGLRQRCAVARRKSVAVAGYAHYCSQAGDRG